MGKCCSKNKGANAENKQPLVENEARGNAAGGAAPKSDLLKPFHMNVQVLNKEEVIEKKAGWLMSGIANMAVSDTLFSEKVAKKLETMLPEKIRDAAGIETTCVHKSTNGTTFVMEMRVLGYEMAAIAKAAFKLDDPKAKIFKDSFDQITPILMRMGMEEKAQGVHESVAIKVRRGVMTKLEQTLPEKLAASAELKASVEVPELKTEPEPVKAVPPTTADVGLQEPMYFRAVIKDKKAMFENLQAKKEAKDGKSMGLSVACKLGSHLPDSVLAELVENLLVKKIPAKMEEKAGIQAECESVSKSGFDSSVDVKLIVKSFEQRRLFTVAKGEAFADAFEELWKVLTAMADCGVATIQEKMTAINYQIAIKVRDGVKAKFSEALAKEMAAEVTALEAPAESK